MEKQENRVTIRHPRTGMLVTVPQSKAEQLLSSEKKELSPEAKAKFDRAWERVSGRIFRDET